MARYFLKFRHSDTGLTPTFTQFKKVADLTNVLPVPTPVVEVGFGEYYFDYVPTFDITFEVDGGASIPTEEVRYIADTISPRDIYLDEPISQVKDDVWNDTVNRAASTKGEYVETIGLPADNSAQATLFGKTLLYKESVRGDSAGTSDGENVKLARDRVMGGTGFGGTGVDVKTVNDNLGTAQADLTAIKGAGFATGTDSLKVISDNVDTVNANTAPAAVANSVWDATTTGNITPGTMGGLVNTASGAPSAATIAGAVWDEATAGHNSFGTFGQTLQVMGSGTAQDGSANTIQLAVGSSSLNDYYKNGLVFITSGTGVGQVRLISGYVGGSVTASVDPVWVTNPIGDDSVYVILPSGLAGGGSAPTAATVASAVWNEALAGHAIVGSSGKKLSDGALTTDVTTAASGITTSLGAQLTRALGLMHENSVMDQTTFDGSNNLTSGRLRIYNSKANALAAGLTGLLNTYTITASYIGENVQTYTVVLEP